MTLEDGRRLDSMKRDQLFRELHRRGAPVTSDMSVTEMGRCWMAFTAEIGRQAIAERMRGILP
jgi:hypothetical protein